MTEEKNKRVNFRSGHPDFVCPYIGPKSGKPCLNRCKAKYCARHRMHDQLASKQRACSICGKMTTSKLGMCTSHSKEYQRALQLSHRNEFIDFIQKEAQPTKTANPSTASTDGPTQ